MKDGIKEDGIKDDGSERDQGKVYIATSSRVERGTSLCCYSFACSQFLSCCPSPCIPRLSGLGSLTN